MPSIDSNRKAAQEAIANGQLVRATPPAVNIAPPTPPVTDTNKLNSYLRTPLPPSYVQQPDQQRVWQAGGVLPQNRVPPLPPSANAQVGAAAASQATIVVENTPSTPGTATSSQVTLDVPNIFTPPAQTVTLPGPLSLSLATEPASTFFGTPGPGLGGFQGLGQGTGTGAVSVSATPTSSPSFAIWAGNANNSITAPAGWTTITTGNQSVWYKAVTGLSPVTVSSSFGSGSWEGSIVLFTGPIPSLVQSKTGTFGASNSGTVTFTSNNTAGNTLVVVCQAFNFNTTGFGITISDSLGNTYQQLVNQYAPVVGGSPELQQYIFVVSNCAAGANTVTINFGGTGSTTTNIVLTEWGPFPSGSSLPFFRTLTSADIPQINLNAQGNGGVGGILKVKNGGTSSDLSITGGVSQFLRQNSSGGAVTVVQPDFSDLAGAAGAFPAKYNGVSTVSNGLPSEIAKVDLTAQTAAIGTTTLYAVPAAGAGQYRLGWNAKVTTAAGVSSTLGPLTVVYTDPDGVALTVTAAAQNTAGTIETSDTGNTTATAMLGNALMLNCKASTNITYAFSYASNAASAMNFNLHMKLESL